MVHHPKDRAGRRDEGRRPQVAAETIAAIATAPGRGALGIVRLSGPAAFDIAAALAGPLPAVRQPGLRPFRDAGGEVIDQGLVLAFAAPHSFTGEDVVELQGHGAPVVLAALVAAAVAHGARAARPGEFSERAFLNDRIDLAQAEAIADLIDAASTEAARAAQRSLDGVFSRRIEALLESLIQLRVFVEGALDFSDEDIDWLSDVGLHQRLQALLSDFDVLLAEAAQGRRLREGLVVALAGQPNAGKSTLLNRLAGTEAAIVSTTPGTTRDLLRESIVLDGLPLTLVDTAGLRDSEDPIEREGIRRAWELLGKAELALFLADDRDSNDAGQPGPADQALLAQLPDQLPVLVLLNKCDLSGRAPSDMEGSSPRRLRLSAATGDGCEALRAAIREAAGLGPVQEGLFSARTRHLLALREAQAAVHAARHRLDERSHAELAAEELHRAQRALGEITGRFVADDLLGRVFSQFCIGK